MENNIAKNNTKIIYGTGDLKSIVNFLLERNFTEILNESIKK